MIGYIFYIIFRFSKPPPSINDNKKKEVDVYKIQKIYMFSSICFVICAFFIINPLLTFQNGNLYQYIRYLSIFFGIFNAVMTVLYIKYRDDIYFYETYNLIFTLLITFGAMSSDYKDVAYFMYERFNKRDSDESTHVPLHHDIIRGRTGGHIITTPLNKLTRFDLTKQSTNTSNSKRLHSIPQGLHNSERFEPVVRQLSRRNSIL